MDELKTIIRALAISKAANGITVAQLSKDFKALEGYAIPYSKYGFQSLDGLLRTMTDAIQVNGYGLTAVVQPLTNEKTQHVREMVKRNKPDRKKSSDNYRSNGYQANYRNNFYNDHYSSHLADYSDDRFDDEIPYANVIVNVNGTKNNAENQQQLYNGHNEVQQKTNQSVPISPQCFNDANNERQKKREEILAKLMKQISTRTTNAVPDNTKTITEKLNASIDSSTNELTVPEDAMTRKQKIVATLPGHLQQPEATAKVVVTSVLNPKRMYVHLCEHTVKLRQLASLLDSIYSTKATGYEWLIPDTMIQVGMYCAAKYHNRWYRAEVMGPANFQRVLLSYIDYGYLRYVPLADIRFLAKEFASVPRQLVGVALTHVKPSEGCWSKEACAQLANMVHRKVFDMMVVNVDVQENILNVILTDASNCTIVQTNPDKSSLNRQLATSRSDILWLGN